MSRKLYIGIDIGGTKIAAALVDENGRIHRWEKISTPKRSSPREIIQCLSHLLKEILIVEKLKMSAIKGMGVGIPGIVDVNEHKILITPNINLSGVPLGQKLEAQYKIKVRLGNDVNLGLLGEQWLGVAKKSKNVLGLFPGTGIGGAIIINGKLFLGAHGAAAEIGHMIMVSQGPLCSCGNRGCLEALASRWAIERDIREAIKHGQTSIITELTDGRLTTIKSKMLKKALKEKDSLVTEVITRAAIALGNASISLTHIFNPEMIVLGGGVIEACGDFILPIVKKVASSDPFFPKAHHPKIVESELADDAVVLGAVALVKRR